MIHQISEQLLIQKDLLDPKVQALHRLHLSYLREFQKMKKSLAGEALSTALHPENGEVVTPEENTVQKEIKKSPSPVQSDWFHRLNEVPSGLLMKPLDQINQKDRDNLYVHLKNQERLKERSAVSNSPGTNQPSGAKRAYHTPGLK